MKIAPDRRMIVRLALLAGALAIVLLSLWFTHNLAKQIEAQERSKVELWANAYKNLNLADEDDDLSFLFEVIKNNETVPVILTDENGIIRAWRNFDSVKVKKDSTYLQKELEKIKAVREPIAIEIAPDTYNYIYYKDSILLTRLRYFPFVQLAIITVFLIIVYYTFSISRKSEQNQLWVGMAKETAHQLGTPISSLMGWLENLKEMAGPQFQSILPELENDIKRLETIAERFSKIGSRPDLAYYNLRQVLEKNIRYISQRTSQRIEIALTGEGEVQAFINAPLFDWVIENLLKNAIDAMEGEGKISVSYTSGEKGIIIDITDTGKGIPKSKWRTVFEPGFSTKKRGWGLGLTLAKRIISGYHRGKIFVKESVTGKGTTIRIILPNG